MTGATSALTLEALVVSTDPDEAERELAAAVATIAEPARGALREQVRAQVAAEMDAKLKPIGAFGGLEALAIRFAGIRGTATPGELRPAVVVCAADHGLAAENVSAYPPEVTGLMLESVAAGGAGISVLCARSGATLVVADLGVTDPPACVGEQVLDLRVRPGTGNSAVEPAMTREQALLAIRYGMGIANALADEGVNAVVLGELGIGNTATAAALTARLLDVEPARVCGPGTGLDSRQLRGKVATVERVLARHPNAREPLDVLVAMGGLEVAALVGVTLACAARGVVVLVDGLITGAAALSASRIAPESVESMIAGHQSAEPGHAVQLEALGLAPILRLEMRLGEGTGAAVALPVVQAALDILADMATYASLGIGDH